MPDVAPPHPPPQSGSDEHDRGSQPPGVRDILDTDTIFSRILVTADEEFHRSTRLLALSGLAAGLIMSLSFLGKAVMQGALGPDASLLLTSLLYPIGFVFVVVGRYQLFTENTLTPVTLVLTRTASIPKLLFIWSVVLGTNILGVGAAAWYFVNTGVFGPETAQAATSIAEHAISFSWMDLFTKGTIAGWLVAGMVWLNHAARTATARILTIFFLMYTVSAADLTHCIVGSSEVLYLLFQGEVTTVQFLWDYLTPAVLGNTAGGVFLVALLNYARTREEDLPDRKVITWRELFLGEQGTSSREEKINQEA
jgi:formate/nitrite transporter FocA (FNT family)